MTSSRPRSRLGVKSCDVTIGFGTYNRASTAASTAALLLGAHERSGLQILVVDDASTDETPQLFDELKACHGSLLTVIRHQRRQGFAGALATLLRRSESRWLVLGSDDDEILSHSLYRLEELLVEYEPDVLIPSFDDGPSGLIRRKPTGTRVVPEKVWGTLGHAPGIVFNVPAARQHVTALESLLECGNNFAAVYPQVIIGVGIAASGGKIVHWEEPLARTGANLRSGIRDSANDTYWSMPSRMRQFFDFQDHLVAQSELTVSPMHEVFRSIYDWNRLKLLDFFIAWLTVDRLEHSLAVSEARFTMVPWRQRLFSAFRLLVLGRPH